MFAWRRTYGTTQPRDRRSYVFTERQLETDVKPQCLDWFQQDSSRIVMPRLLQSGGAWQMAEAYAFCALLADVAELFKAFVSNM